VGAEVKRPDLSGMERKDDYIDIPEYDCMEHGCGWTLTAIGGAAEEILRMHIVATGHHVRIASVFEVWGPK
jgi:hypothetical protein